jgi:hypothetical protein
MLLASNMLSADKLILLANMLSDVIW